jgi:hypothetical protein
MKLYRYFDKNGIDVLRNLRLKVSDPTKFNDPFEFLPGIIGEPKRSVLKRHIKHPQDRDRYYKMSNFSSKKEFKKYLSNISIDELFENYRKTIKPGLLNELDKQKKKASKTLRVICFSKIKKKSDSYNEILMWAHYAKSNNGFRICFETDFFGLKSKSLFPISYSDQRPAIDVNKTWDAEKVYDDLLQTKFETWKYENEYRWLISIEECIFEKAGNKTLDFIKIRPEAICSIDIGINVSSKQKDEIVYLIKKDKLKHIKVSNAVMHESEYKLDYVNISNN